MASVVKPCDCVHEFQDKQYGKGIRLFNEGKDGKFFRCTVCKKTKNK